MRRNRSVSLRGAIHTFVLRSDDGADSYPTGLALAANGDLLIANSLGHRVCRLTPNGALSLLAGGGAPGFVDGVRDRARFNNPKAVAVDADGLVYVADCENHAIRTVDPATGAVATFAGHGTPGFEDGKGRDAGLRSPRGVAFDADGSLLVATMHAVRRIALDGTTTTLARNGRGSGARRATLGFLGGICADPRYGILVSDTTHHAIWRLDANGELSLFAGGNRAGLVDGRWEAAAFNKPRGIAVDELGRVLVADSKNDALRVLLPSGTTETVRGEDVGLEDGFDYPSGVAAARDSSVYLADQLNNRIYRIVL